MALNEPRKATIQQIARLKEVYGMDYGVEASHHLMEIPPWQKEE